MRSPKISVWDFINQRRFQPPPNPVNAAPALAAEVAPVTPEEEGRQTAPSPSTMPVVVVAAPETTLARNARFATSALWTARCTRADIVACVTTALGNASKREADYVRFVARPSETLLGSIGRDDIYHECEGEGGRGGRSEEGEEEEEEQVQ